MEDYYDGLVTYVSSEASAIPERYEEEEEELKLTQPHEEDVDFEAQLTRPYTPDVTVPLTEEVWEEPSFYAPSPTMLPTQTLALAHGALQRSRAILHELQQHEAATAALAITPVPKVPMPATPPPAAPVKMEMPVAPIKMDRPAAPAPPAAAAPVKMEMPVAPIKMDRPAAPASPAAAPVKMEMPVAPITMDRPAAPASPAAAPVKMEMPAAPPQIPAASRLLQPPAMRAASKAFKAAESAEKACTDELKEMTTDGRVCTSACGQSRTRWNSPKNPETGEKDAYWCNSTGTTTWGFCNPYTKENACTSKNLYTLSTLEEYMDTPAYLGFIRDKPLNPLTVYNTIKHASSAVKGVFCEIKTQRKSDPTLWYRLCDQSGLLYDKVRPIITEVLENRTAAGNISDTMWTVFFNNQPQPPMTEAVWKTVLRLIPLTVDEFYRLIVKRYNRRKKVPGFDMKKVKKAAILAIPLLGMAAAAGIPYLSRVPQYNIPEMYTPDAPADAPTPAPAPPPDVVTEVVPEPAPPSMVVPGVVPEPPSVVGLEVATEPVVVPEVAPAPPSMVVPGVVPEPPSVVGLEVAPAPPSVVEVFKPSADITASEDLDLSRTASSMVHTNTAEAHTLALGVANRFDTRTELAEFRNVSALLNVLDIVGGSKGSNTPEITLAITTVVNATTDMCARLNAVPLPITTQEPTLLVGCNALQTQLTVYPRAVANVTHAVEHVQKLVTQIPPSDAKKQEPSPAIVYGICNLTAQFPQHIREDRVSQLMTIARTNPAAEYFNNIQHSLSAVAVASNARDVTTKMPVLVQMLVSPSNYPIVRAVTTIANAITAVASDTQLAIASRLPTTVDTLKAVGKGVANVAATGLGIAAVGASALILSPLYIGIKVKEYLTSKPIVEAASSPTQAAGVNVMTNPYCTLMSKYETRLKHALQSSGTTAQLMYNETVDTCSTLYTLAGVEPPKLSISGASDALRAVDAAVKTLQRVLPETPDYTLYADAFEAQAAFMDNVTATDNGVLINATVALCNSMPEDQASALTALERALELEMEPQQVSASFEEWQTAQTALTTRHKNGTLTKDMIVPIKVLHNFFIDTLQARDAMQTVTSLTLDDSANLHQSIVLQALNVTTVAQELAAPSILPAVPTSSLMVSETQRPFTRDDMRKSNWVQLTCNLASKNMTDNENGRLVVDALPTTLVTNLQSPWTLVQSDSAFIGVAKMGTELTWVNATCTPKGGVSMEEMQTPPPSGAAFFEACKVLDSTTHVLEGGGVPDMEWNIRTQQPSSPALAIDNPAAFMRDAQAAQLPKCVFIPYAWALPPSQALTLEGVQFFEQVYSRVQFSDVNDQPHALGWANTAAHLVACASVGAVTNLFTFGIAGMVFQASSTFPRQALELHIKTLEQRVLEVEDARTMLYTAAQDIKAMAQFSSAEQWVQRLRMQTRAQLDSAKSQLDVLVGERVRLSRGSEW
jgi:hypothetical protein